MAAPSDLQNLSDTAPSKVRSYWGPVCHDSETVKDVPSSGQHSTCGQSISPVRQGKEHISFS